MITVVVIRTAKGNYDRLVESLTFEHAIIYLAEVDYTFPTSKEFPWKMFLYDSEFLSYELAECLPIYLNYTEEFDFFSLYGRMGSLPYYTYFQCPRIFRRDLELRKDSLLPKEINSLRGIAILDGFLEAS